MSAYGIEGDGQLTAGAAAIGLVLLLVRRARARLWFYIVQALLGALAGAIGLYHAATTEFAAFGVYLTLLAGIVWLAAAGVGFRERRADLLADARSSPEPLNPATPGDRHG